MARKRQTTGLPKARKRKSTDAQLSDDSQRGGLIKPLREYKSRADREAAVQRWVILGVGAAIAIVAIVIVIAVVFDQFIVPNRSVASVNGVDISVGDYEDRVRLERVISIHLINTALNDLIDLGLTFEQASQQVTSVEPFATLWNELNFADQLGLRVLNDIIDDQIVLAEADQAGISVTEEQIDEQIRELFGALAPSADELDPEATEEPTLEPTITPTPFVSPTPSPTPTVTPTSESTAEATPDVEPTATSTPFPTIEPTATQTIEERQDRFNDAVDALFERAQDAGASRSDVLRYFELRALRVVLAQEVLEAGDTTTWANVRHILVETEEEALDLLAALNAGESFANLAQTASVDPGSGARGGELDWAPTQNYVPEFAEAVNNATIGELTGPVQSDFGYHIIQVRAREEREIEEEQINANRRNELSEFVAELRESDNYDVVTENIWPDHVPESPQFVYRAR